MIGHYLRTLRKILRRPKKQEITAVEFLDELRGRVWALYTTKPLTDEIPEDKMELFFHIVAARNPPMGKVYKACMELLGKVPREELVGVAIGKATSDRVEAEIGVRLKIIARPVDPCLLTGYVCFS